MAATISQDWQTVINSEPTGALTIGSGSNRMFVLVTTAETDGDYTISTLTVGGQAASYTFDFFWESGGTNDLKVTAYVWNEAAVAAMSGSTVSYTDDSADAKKHFNYITMQDCEQQSPPADSPTVAAGTTHDIDTPSTANDWIVMIAAGQSNARDITDWDTLTEFWDDGADSYRSSGGDGQGGDDVTTLTIGLSDELLALGLVFEAVVAAPGPATPLAAAGLIVNP